MSNYEVKCTYCGAKFTAYEWSHHSPDCPYNGQTPLSDRHAAPDEVERG